MTQPDVSVVMGIYNEQTHLKDTIESVLSQEGVKLEFIIVNDGSTDESESIIRSYAKRDPRIHLYNQTNQGLTKALIAGCNHAIARYIARQDAGDLSLPGRLKAQKDMLDSQSEMSMCSTAVIYLAPDGEKFGKTIQSAEDAREGLTRRSINTIQGPPHHGSVMFRKQSYDKVGGYRKQFYVAQDLDLWTRMIEHGQHGSLQTIYYEAIANSRSISSLRRDQQVETTKVILECCEARANNGDDSRLLEKARKASKPKEGKTAIATSKSESDFLYFVGSYIKSTNPKASRKYLKRALAANPWNWKALAKLVLYK